MLKRRDNSSRKGTVAPPSRGEQTTQKQNRKRFFAFRALALLLGLLPFLIFEIGLTISGWQPPDGIKDPYVGFDSVRPLFELSADATRYEISESRKPLFCADSFAAKKGANEFRIFCVGGSTVQGRPFAIETAFSSWLELKLQSTQVESATDSKKWNVINCGGVSYASYRLAPIVEEIVEYEPDLIVVYTGHNEFLEDRTYDSIKSASPWLVDIHNRMSSVKTYSFLRNFTIQDPTSETLEGVTKLPAEVEARLDFKNGLEKYVRDEKWKSDVVDHFEHNLRRMVGAAKTAGVPMLICNPVSNLRDASPFKAEHRSGLSKSGLAEFEEIWVELIEEKLTLPEQLERLESLVKIDPQHAGLQYRIGQTLQQMGEFEKAKQHLIEAKEQDICPLRIVEPMYKVIERVARDADVPLIDVKADFESRAKDNIPGSELLVDHIHPSIRGHQLIADLIFDAMEERGLVSPTDSLKARQAKNYEQHLADLPHMYFQLGKDRLAGLKRWAEGRVTKERNSK